MKLEELYYMFENITRDTWFTIVEDRSELTIYYGQFLEIPQWMKSYFDVTSFSVDGVKKGMYIDSLIVYVLPED